MTNWLYRKIDYTENRKIAMNIQGFLKYFRYNFFLLVTYDMTKFQSNEIFFGIIFTYKTCLLRWSQRENPTNKKEAISK